MQTHRQPLECLKELHSHVAQVYKHHSGQNAQAVLAARLLNMYVSPFEVQSCLKAGTEETFEAEAIMYASEKLMSCTLEAYCLTYRSCSTLYTKQGTSCSIQESLACLSSASRSSPSLYDSCLTLSAQLPACLHACIFCISCIVGMQYSLKNPYAGTACLRQAQQQPFLGFDAMFVVQLFHCCYQPVPVASNTC